jgi:subtilase family serine protease
MMLQKNAKKSSLAALAAFTSKTDTLFRPVVGRKRPHIACSLAALLMTGVAMPALANEPLADKFIDVQDLGPIDAATPMTAVVWLKRQNQSGLDQAVAQRYDRTSPTYHQWLTPAEAASFGPKPQDVATAQASLRALGLKVETVSNDGTAIKVSATADKMQAAFGTAIHLHQPRRSGGATFFANVAAPRYQGAHPELINTVSGLTQTRAQPFVLRQVDLSTGLVTPGVSAQAAANPLSAFTNDCFGPSFTAKWSGIGIETVVGGTPIFGEVADTFKGPTYLNIASTTRPTCAYTAGQVAAHYGLDHVFARGLTGKGQTIVIVDAFGSPTIQADANAFSQAMGLPALDENNFQIVFPGGQPTTTDLGWATETSLDVEWAHAVAPGAKIVLVVAPTNQDSDLSFADHFAVVNRLGNVISNSFGSPEAGSDPADGLAVAQLYSNVFELAAATGISVNVATGDSGDFGLGTPVGAASIPADSPFATGVGGTSINVPGDHGPVESAWGIVVTDLGTLHSPFPTPDILGFLQGGGGGESAILAKPFFQGKLRGSGRQLPDVSFLADPQTGAIIVQTVPLFGGGTGTEFCAVGGTSLAAPMFAAMWALADEAAGESLGQAAPALAAMPSNAFRDIVPIDAERVSTSGSILFRGTTLTHYDPAQVLGLEQTQPSGFVGALVLAGDPRVPVPAKEAYKVIGFGADSSLQATEGWDNATGFGVPNGTQFIDAAAHLRRKSRDTDLATQ